MKTIFSNKQKRKGDSSNIIIAIFLICSILLFIYQAIMLNKNQTKNNISSQSAIETQISAPLPSEKYTNNEIINLAINPVSDYKNMSKEEIYSLRTKYVKESIFSYPEYKPSEDVFGQIISYEPWYGLTYSGCIVQTIGTEKVIEGPSEESRFINNPNILVGLLIGSKQVEPGDPICFDKNYWMLPVSGIYNAQTNTIEVTYNFRYDYQFTLAGLNARDLGYSYIYAETPQGYHFINQQNISNEVHQLQDYIHLGGSCQYKNGCNNGSPYQPQIIFAADEYPLVVNLKLWRNQPLTPSQKADINYKIIIK